MAKVGGFKKDEYASFINVGAVEMDEQGNIVQDSLEAEVMRIKQSYPELLKGNSAANLPAEAPKSPVPTLDKEFSKMSEKERNALRMSLITKKK